MGYNLKAGPSETRITSAPRRFVLGAWGIIVLKWIVDWTNLARILVQRSFQHVSESGGCVKGEEIFDQVVGLRI